MFTIDLLVTHPWKSQVCRHDRLIEISPEYHLSQGVGELP